MQPEPEPGSKDAPYDNPARLMALLQAHMVARRAIRRLESLCAHYPDPAVKEAVEALRREEDEWQRRADAPHLP